MCVLNQYFYVARQKICTKVIHNEIKFYGCTFYINVHLNCNLIFFHYCGYTQLLKSKLHDLSKAQFNGYERILTDQKLVDFVFLPPLRG